MHHAFSQSLTVSSFVRRTSYGKLAIYYLDLWCIFLAKISRGQFFNLKFKNGGFIKREKNDLQKNQVLFTAEPGQQLKRKLK